MRVLIVDGHVASAGFLRDALLRNGFSVDLVGDGIEGQALALRQDYSLVVLELDLPGLDGRDVLSGLRAAKSTPVIVITSRDSLDEQVFCLQNGADDYMVKPLRLPEFLARANLRMRSHGPAAPDRQQRLSLSDLVLDLSKKRAERAGLRLDLTRQEFVLLKMLLLRQGDIVPRTDLIAQIWNLPCGAPTNVVDVAIRRLRSKLDDPYQARLLHTVRGQGYVLELR